MAENLETTTTVETENQNIENAENTPSVDELMAELFHSKSALSFQLRIAE